MFDDMVHVMVRHRSVNGPCHGPSPVRSRSVRGLSLVHHWSIRGPFAVHSRSVRGLSLVHHWSIRGPFAVRSRSITGSFAVHSRSITGSFAVHVIDWEHQLAHFCRHFTLQYLHVGLTQITLGGSFGGSFWDHFFDIGCGRTSCFNLCLGWAIVQGAIRRASIPYLGFENVSQAGKSAPKKWSKLTRTGENRPKMEKVAPANKGFRSQLPRLPHASTPHAGPL
jgi:hypothetical protein